MDENTHDTTDTAREHRADAKGPHWWEKEGEDKKEAQQQGLLGGSDRTEKVEKDKPQQVVEPEAGAAKTNEHAAGKLPERGAEPEKDQAKEQGGPQVKADQGVGDKEASKGPTAYSPSPGEVMEKGLSGGEKVAKASEQTRGDAFITEMFGSKDKKQELAKANEQEAGQKQENRRENAPEKARSRGMSM